MAKYFPSEGKVAVKMALPTSPIVTKPVAASIAATEESEDEYVIEATPA